MIDTAVQFIAAVSGEPAYDPKVGTDSLVFKFIVFCKLSLIGGFVLSINS